MGEGEKFRSNNKYGSNLFFYFYSCMLDTGVCKNVLNKGDFFSFLLINVIVCKGIGPKVGTSWTIMHIVQKDNHVITKY